MRGFPQRLNNRARAPRSARWRGCSHHPQALPPPTEAFGLSAEAEPLQTAALARAFALVRRTEGPGSLSKFGRSDTVARALVSFFFRLVCVWLRFCFFFCVSFLFLCCC